MSAPSPFQRMMNELLGSFYLLRVYLDDLMDFSKNLQQHIQHLCHVVRVESGHVLKLKLCKCAFGKREIAFLGHIINSRGVGVDPLKISTIQDTARPRYRTDLCSFLGIAGYYRRFTRSSASISAPSSPFPPPLFPSPQPARCHFRKEG